MADTKLVDMTAITLLAAADIIYVTDNPGGSPLDRSATVQDVHDAINVLTDDTGLAVGDLMSVYDVTGTTAVKATLSEILAVAHNHTAAQITSGTLAHERGGLEADVSAYDGLLRITGGATSAVTVTAFALTVLDDADAATVRTTIGAASASDVTALETGYSRRSKVIGRVDNTAVPATEVSGDRYLLDETGGGVHADWDGAAVSDLVEFNGTLWVAVTPVEGYVVYNDADGLDWLFVDDGSPAWESRPTGSGISSLGGQTGASQTFATVSDANVTLSIVSTGDIHTGTTAWAGTLSHERGGLEADVSAYAGLVEIDSGTTSAITCTAFAKTILDDADAATVRATIGVGTGSGDFLAAGTVAMTGDFDGDGFNLSDCGVVFLREQAAADADVAAQGQIWVKTATPNQLWFTDDAGTDTQLGTGGGGSLTNWTESTGTETTQYCSFVTTNAATDIHAVISPKGTGGLISHVPDGTSTGGNDRGTYTVDLQVDRLAATDVASGNWSTIAGGNSGKASGHYSTVCGGSNNVASGQYSFVGGGTNSAGASGTYSAVLAGINNSVAAVSAISLAGDDNDVQSAAVCSVVHGIKANATRHNEHAHGLKGSAAGEAQMSRCGGTVVTTDATETELFLDGVTGTLRLDVPTNGVLTGVVRVSARRTDVTGESEGFYMEFCVENDNGTTAILGSPVVNQHALTTWSITVTADDTNDAIVVKVTGEAGKTIRWVAGFDFVQSVP
jgi:hypothetical protein